MEICTPTLNGENQRVYFYTATSYNVANISIYADNTVPDEWLRALKQSIINWNSTNSRVTMKRVTDITTTTTTGKREKEKDHYHNRPSRLQYPCNNLIQCLYFNGGAGLSALL
jgi:hypothetical protein